MTPLHESSFKQPHMTCDLQKRATIIGETLNVPMHRASMRVLILRKLLHKALMLKLPIPRLHSRILNPAWRIKPQLTRQLYSGYV